jgi:hypothetical protein
MFSPPVEPASALTRRAVVFLHSTDLQRSISRMEFRTRLNGLGQTPLVRDFPYAPTTFGALVSDPVRWLGAGASQP